MIHDTEGVQIRLSWGDRVREGLACMEKAFAYSGFQQERSRGSFSVYLAKSDKAKQVVYLPKEGALEQMGERAN